MPGVILFIAALVLLRYDRVLQRLTYTAGLGGIVLLLCCCSCRSSAATRTAPTSGSNVAGFSFQPGEVAKVLLVVAFSGYLVLHRDALALAGRRVVFIDLPRGRDLGRSAQHVRRLDDDPGAPERPCGSSPPSSAGLSW